MSKGHLKFAKSVKLDRISAVWVIPIVTLVIGVWMIFSHFAEQGRMVTLIADDASGIVAGKTVIKSRSVDVGLVEVVTLNDDYSKVIIQGRINKDMDELINNDSQFWIVKPQVSLEGVTGLGTIFSGIYIELSSGNDKMPFDGRNFHLLDSPPMFSLAEAGIRVNLNSDQNGVIPVGAPVMFRGYRVGNVEKSQLNIESHRMEYQLFIYKPYDELVTENVRFWKEAGVNLSLSPRGASLNIPSLDVLLSGGISFDVPEGVKFGTKANDLSTYKLFENKQAIQSSQYTQYHEFLLFFDESISGLNEGSPVEFRGIQLGVVSHAPFYNKEMIKDMPILSFKIPVLIRIEPGRLSNIAGEPVDLTKLLIGEQINGLRASLKSSNLLTGAVYIELDFYPDLKGEANTQKQEFGYDTILTTSSGLSQIQTKVSQLLDNLNKLPLDQTVNELNQALIKSQSLIESLTAITSSKEAQKLPKDLQATMQSLNSTLKSLQPGSEMHGQLQADMQKFGQTMDELTKLLETLNEKSNALIFAAPQKQDPQPKAKGQ